LEASLVGHRPTVPPSPEPAPPLPAVFRLDGAGRPVAVEAGTAKAGQGAGGGRRAGRVVHDVTEIDGDGPAVLVTTTLDPSLAAMLPALSGLISETGSVLSHLAILARELGVPTVVGVADARVRYEVGTSVVDGSTGAIEVES
jgi:rifampicin phosphotransferase